MNFTPLSVGNSSQKLKFYIICNSVWWVKLP